MKKGEHNEKRKVKSEKHLRKGNFVCSLKYENKEKEVEGWKEEEEKDRDEDEDEGEKGEGKRYL